MELSPEAPLIRVTRRLQKRFPARATRLASDVGGGEFVAESQHSYATISFGMHTPAWLLSSHVVYWPTHTFILEVYADVRPHTAHRATAARPRDAAAEPAPRPVRG